MTLTRGQVFNLRRRASRGEPLADLAVRYGCAYQTAWRVAHGHTYQSAPGPLLEKKQREFAYDPTEVYLTKIRKGFTMVQLSKHYKWPRSTVARVAARGRVKLASELSSQSVVQDVRSLAKTYRLKPSQVEKLVEFARRKRTI